MMGISNLDVSVRRVVLTLVVLALVFQPVLVGDLYGYLVYGEWMVNQGQITRVDTFSFTARGTPWINHEWLFEVGLWVVFDSLGWVGLLGVQACLVAGILFLLGGILSQRARDFPSWSLSFVVPVMALVPGLTLRPQLVTCLFILLLIVLMGRDRLLGWTGGLFLLFLFITWSNIHGGVVVGLGFLGYLLVDRSVQRPKPGQLVRSVVVFAACLLATLVNPYGIELWSMVRETVADPLTAVFIEEWQPVWSHPYHATVWCLLGVQWVVPLFVFSESHDRRTVLRTFCLTAAGVLSLWPRRNLTYYGLAVAAFALPVPGDWIPEIDVPEQMKRGLTTGATIGAVLLLGWTVSGGFYVSQDPYPDPMMDKIRTRSGGETNVFAYYPWAQWVLYEDRSTRVFLDGRWKTVYPETVIRDYGRLLVGDAGLLSKYQIDWVLLPERYNLNRVLFGSEDWTIVARYRGNLLWKHRLEGPST